MNVTSRVLAASLVLLMVGCKSSSFQPLKKEVHEDPDTETPVTPTASLAAATYAGGNVGINSTGTATLVLTFTHADSTTLAAATGTSSAPPAGLVVVESGATCTDIEIVTPTTAGATITVTGCTGDGSISVQVAAGVATSSTTDTNAASTARSVVVDNTTPTATLAVSNATVATANGANTVTATFDERVANLSTTNANGEFEITGDCATAPTVAIAMSVNGSGNSVATATLSGGVCTDLDDVDVRLRLDNVTDRSGNAGDAGDNQDDAYVVDLAASVATLAAADYPSSWTALELTTSATLDLTFTNADTLTLANGSGSSGTPLAGLTINETGTASCTNVDVSGITTAGATITVSGCSGDGTIEIQVDAGAVTSSEGMTSDASGTEVVEIRNTETGVTSVAVRDATTNDTSGANEVVVTFDQIIPDLDAGNAAGAIAISGDCATLPTAAIAMSVVGGVSVATATLSGGICADPDVVYIDVDTALIPNPAGVTGTVDPGQESYTIVP